MKRYFFLAIFLHFSLILCIAETKSEAPKAPYSMNFYPKGVGWTIELGYTGVHLFENLTTTFHLTTGLAYEQMSYYRLSDGSMYRGSDGTDFTKREPVYDRVSTSWREGIVQGLVGNGTTGKDLLSVFFMNQGRYDTHLEKKGVNQLLFGSSITDRDGILQNSLLAGLLFDTLSKDTVHQIFKGLYGEVSVEWGPGWYLNSIKGTSDFIRLNGTAKAFFPIYVAPSEREGNLFGLYAGMFLSFDYSTGTAIPLNIRQTFGGLSPRIGLGGAVRGLDMASYDTVLKGVGNLEIRATLPSIGLPGIVPGIITYVDAGYYRDIGSHSDPVPTGIVSSAGAGVYVNFMNLTDLVLCTHYLLTEKNANGDSLTMISIAFGLSF